MTLQELTNLDKTFNPATFISKCNHVFIKYLSAIMMDNLKEVDHFISDDVYKYGELIIAPLRSRNLRQMYDELNIKNTRIHNVELINNKYVITVFIESKYMDYIINKDTGNTVEGNDKTRIQVNYRLTFTKDVNAINEGEAKKCQACGSPMNINDSGICEYCGSIYQQEKHGWILNNIAKVSTMYI